MVGKIYINRLLGDRTQTATMIASRLRRKFGRNNVIYADADTDDMEWSDVGPTARSQLRNCKVFISIIGPNSRSPIDEWNHRGALAPSSWRFRELADALNENLIVIPLLVDGARFPMRHELPSELHPILHLHAASVADSTFVDDMKRLENALSRPVEPPPSSFILTSMFGAFGVVAILSWLGLATLPQMWGTWTSYIFSQFTDRCTWSDTNNEVPEFPWPPPAPSSQYVVPAGLFSGITTVGGLTARISQATEEGGYSEKAYFKSPGCRVVIVMRMERVRDDGAPEPKETRWTTREMQNHLTKQSIADLLKGLFLAEPGRYRVIAFVIGSGPITYANRRSTEAEAIKWLSAGATALPKEMATRPLQDNDAFTALVYEFVSKDRRMEATMLRPGLPARTHLEKTGILAALEK